MSTLKLARRSVFVVICISFIHAIVFGLLFDYKPSITCAVLNPMLINYFSYFFYPVLCGFLPILIASSCSLLAYRNVRRIIRRQINVVRRCLDRQLTAMGLTRVGFFIICKTPFAMYRIYSIEINTDPTDLLRLAIEKMISVVISSLFKPDFAVKYDFNIDKNMKMKIIFR
jgi:hypothetical protein